MDSKEHLTLSCETLSTTAPEAKMNLQISTQTFKIEIKEETPAECSDEEESPGRQYMNPSELLESPEYRNYYDSNIDVLEELKKEFLEDECSQSNHSMNHKIVSENTELLTLIKKQKVKIENTDVAFSLNLKKANCDRNNQITIKTEMLEEQDINWNNSGATSVHYDALVNPQEVKCMLCDRIFKNSFNLLRHNNDHLKIEMNTQADCEFYEVHQYQYCGKGFNNHDNMLAHVGDVHSEEQPKGGLYGKQFQSVSVLKRTLVSPKIKNLPNQVTPNHNKSIHCNIDSKHKSRLNNHMNLCRIGKEDEKMKYKCDLCETIYKNKNYLTKHINRMHYDYGRTFDCWCGKEYRTPEYLREHMSRHDGKMKNSNNDNFQCDSCQKTFKTKHYLKWHIKTVHYDYGKVFECWCGKQFRTPIHLRQHKKRHTDGNINDANNDELHRLKNRVKLCITVKDGEEIKYKCDSCERLYKSKRTLVAHIKKTHYDYGRMFECWCGKQFPSPIHLAEHKSLRQCTNRDNELYKCKFCEALFNAKKSLTEHIKRMHYDYGKTFECWCGKQFRTPQYLREHMRRHEEKNKNRVQCDYCQKQFKIKRYLKIHMKKCSLRLCDVTRPLITPASKRAKSVAERQREYRIRKKQQNNEKKSRATYFRQYRLKKKHQNLVTNVDSDSATMISSQEAGSSGYLTHVNVPQLLPSSPDPRTIIIHHDAVIESVALLAVTSDVSSPLITPSSKRAKSDAQRQREYRNRKKQQNNENKSRATYFRQYRLKKKHQN